MHAQNWSDSLRLLCLLIMDEPLSRDEKIQIFKSAAIKFKDQVSPNFTLSEAMAVDWYDQNETRNLKSLSSIYFDSHIRHLLDNLKSLPNKSDVLFALIKSAFSETEKNNTSVDQKNRIIATAIQNWDIGTPQLQQSTSK